ncbi:MAG: hypothetical protein ABIP49_05310 [Lysobacterales bacterium]
MVTKARCIVMVLALMCAGSALAGTVQYEGRATDPGNGRALYTERHLVREVEGRPRERLVGYVCPNGVLFARKVVDYAPSAVAPSFQLDDGRDGYREGVRREGGRIIAFVRERTGAAERNGTLAAGTQLVADAGFDEYVRSNWTALVAGKTLLVDFAVPASRRAYTFKLRKLSSPIVDGVPAHLFRLKVSGLLGLVAPQIDVAYARGSKRLLRFEGVTNLRDAQRDQWTARIAFADRAAQPIDDARWAEVLATPLRRCNAR